MAHRYITWAFEQDIEGAGRKFVLVALADHANGDGYAFPGQKSLAQLTGQGERTVREHLEWLEINGYVRREHRRRKDGTRTSDAYYLPPEDSTGNIRRWSTTGENRRKQQPIEKPDQDATNPQPTTGKNRRLSQPRSTGRIRRSHRQNSPVDANTTPAPSSTTQTPDHQPADFAGHEPINHQRNHHLPQTPNQPGEEGETELQDLTPYQRRQLTKPPDRLTGSILATQHPTAWAALIAFKRVHPKPVPDAQFTVWAAAVLDDTREHGEPIVTAALQITTENCASLNTPWNYYRACIRRAATETNTATRHANQNPTTETITEADINRMFDLARQGALT